eukprot:1162137-Pelagomonas_calceolata.AAC.9
MRKARHIGAQSSLHAGLRKPNTDAHSILIHMKAHEALLENLHKAEQGTKWQQTGLRGVARQCMHMPLIQPTKTGGLPNALSYQHLLAHHDKGSTKCTYIPSSLWAQASLMACCRQSYETSVQRRHNKDLSSKLPPREAQQGLAIRGATYAAQQTVQDVFSLFHDLQQCHPQAVHCIALRRACKSTYLHNISHTTTSPI